MSPADLAARLIDLVSINQTTPVEGGFLKRRRRGRGWIIWLGNVFLHLSHSRIVMFPDARHWRAWEGYSYNLLYGKGTCKPERGALRIAALPGVSLRTRLQADVLTDAMFTAAGREFRRAHALNGWSHGDPHLDNVLEDGERARLIDFETQHDRSLLAHERHADDLLVFLLDLIGHESSERWQTWSRILLTSYGDGLVLKALERRLHMPAGFELILWKCRTNYLPNAVLARRISLLKQIAEDVRCAR